MKAKLTGDEFEKLKTDWHNIRKSEKSQCHVVNTKIHRRYIMENRADDIAYRKRNNRKKEIISIFKDDIIEEATSYAKRVKIEVHDGELVFIDPKGE